MKNLSSRDIAVASALAAFSAVVQLIHIGYQSPTWGMWIDIVAVSWITAFFLYGVRISLLVSLLGALIITLFAPDTWLGAVMKWTATLPMWLSLYIFMIFRKKSLSGFAKLSSLIIPVIGGIVIRNILVLPLNYFFALPIWTGMTTQQAWQAIPWTIIALFNAVQGILDVGIAWLIVYKFRINRIAGQSSSAQ